MHVAGAITDTDETNGAYAAVVNNTFNIADNSNSNSDSNNNIYSNNKSKSNNNSNIKAL